MATHHTAKRAFAGGTFVKTLLVRKGLALI